MSDITLRLVKGSPLTNQEVDDNFANLNTDKYQAGDSASFQDVTLDNMTGPITWNTDEGALDIPLNAQVTLQAGQEFVFYAKATEAIANGDVVMFAGAQGGHLLIAKCDMGAAGFDPSHIVGIATQSFANNEFGYVTSLGKVRGIDTSGFAEGAVLYVDPTTAGGYTTTKPAPPNHIVQIAAVTRSHANQGTILARVSHMPDTDEVPEGSTNLYFTDARAVSAIKADGDWNATNWNTAYGWGNHASAGYLTSIPYPSSSGWWNGYVGVGGDGVMEMGKYMDFHTSNTGGNADYDLRVTVSVGVFSVGGQVNATGGNSGQWNTAYGWGNHASAGYLTSLPSHNHNDLYYTESEADSRFANITGDTFTGQVIVDGGVGVDSSGTFHVRQKGNTVNDGIAITSSHGTAHRIWKDSSGVLNFGVGSNGDQFGIDTSGNLKVNGTTVIDSSRNATFVTTNTSRLNVTQLAELPTVGMTYHTNNWAYLNGGENGLIISTKSNGAEILRVSSDATFSLGGTTVIDSSRNFNPYRNLTGQSDRLLIEMSSGGANIEMYGNVSGVENRIYYDASVHFFRDVDANPTYAHIDIYGVDSYTNYKVNGTTVIDSSRTHFSGTRGYNTTATGTTSLTASTGIKQTYGEGWTAVFADYEPYHEYGLYHNNPADLFIVTAGNSDNNIGSFSVTNHSGNTRTAYQKIIFNQRNGEVSAGGGYKVGTTTVIDAAKNAYFNSITGSASYHEFGDATGSVSNDASWNARLNLAGTQHARLDVKSVSDGIITTMYSHTGNGNGRMGTLSNHPLGLMANGVVYADLKTNGRLNTSSGYEVGGTIVIDSSRNIKNTPSIDNAGSDIIVGPSNSTRLKVRHVDGKHYANDDDNPLYLNYDKNYPVNIGGPNNTAGLDVLSGDIKINGTTVIDSSRSIAAGVITATSTNDVQLYLNGNGSTWAGIAWTDVGGYDYIWYNGDNSTFSIGGNGANVSGKKLHIHGGTTIGNGYAGTAAPTNGLYVQGEAKANSLSINGARPSSAQAYIQSTLQYALELEHNLNATAGFYYDTLSLLNNTNVASNYTQIGFRTADADGQHHRATILARRDGSLTHGGELILRTRVSGGNPTDTLTLKSNGDVRVDRGNLQIGSTTVIDSSRNLTNIGTISSGDITANGLIISDTNGMYVGYYDTGNAQGNWSQFVNNNHADTVFGTNLYINGNHDLVTSNTHSGIRGSAMVATGNSHSIGAGALAFYAQGDGSTTQGTIVAEEDWKFSIKSDAVNSKVSYQVNGTTVIDASRNTAFDVCNANAFAGGAGKIFYPQGAQYQTSASSVAGAIRIVLPQLRSGTMMRMTVKVYEYTGGDNGESFTLELGGYNYSDGYWYNVFANIVGDTSHNMSHNIAFGQEGSNNCIWIGTVGDSWSYPQVFVTEFQGGYNAFESSRWDNGWAISFATTLGSVYNNITANHIGRICKSDFTANGYKVNGTTVIDASRNATLADGAFTGDLYVNSGYSGNSYLRIYKGTSGDGGILFYTNNTINWQNVQSTTGLNWYSYSDGSTVASIKNDGTFTAKRGYQVNGTTVIDGATRLFAKRPIFDSESAGDDALVSRWRYADNDAYQLNIHQRVTSGVVRWSFGQHNNGSTYSDLIVLDRGKVGFGTQNPAQLVDVNGNIAIGGTTVIDSARNATFATGTFNGNLDINTSTQNAIEIFESSGSSGFNYMRFLNTTGSTQYGSIYRSFSSMVYGTSSDYRLKENVVELTNAADRINAIPVRRFNFLEYPDRTVDGFIAHEVQAVVPEAVIGEKDEVDENGNPVYQGIDQSKLVPLLTAGLQEALAEIENLKARLSALENGE